MSEGPVKMARGFQCPKCKQKDLATIEMQGDLVHILELKCQQCKTAWAVEASHLGYWMDPMGRVVAQ